MRLYPVLVDGKWGFIDKTGTLKIEPQFATVRQRDGDGMLFGFAEGLAAVQPEATGGWGYIDTSGRMVIEPRFSLAQPFSEGLAVVVEDGRYYLIDKTGDVALGPFDGVMSFFSGLAFAMDGGKTGYIDKSGDWVSDVEGRDGIRLPILGGLSEGLAVASVPEGSEDAPASLAGGIDESGALVIEPSEDPVTYGYVDKTGAWVIPPQFTEARPFSDGLALVWRERECGCIDKTGAVVIPLEYQITGWEFFGGVARVGGGFAPPYIDTTGEVIWQGE